jgi:polyhydroxyalkanoate synthesis regulator phasin
MEGAREQTGEARRSVVEELLLAGIGWASLTAEALDEAADELAGRVGVERDRMRTAVRDVASGWKKDAQKVPGADDLVERLVSRLRLVRREELDELALRLAQLEHRLRLLERERPQ